MTLELTAQLGSAGCHGTASSQCRGLPPAGAVEEHGTAEYRRTVPPGLSIPGAGVAADCRHYRGDKPCIHNRLCTGCNHYSPASHRLCIIKLGALGDVIRTLCILPALRRLHPEAHITWVSLPAGCRMIAGHPLIDRVIPFDALSAMALTHERFDTMICLDKEPQPCSLAMSLQADRKLGVALSAWGTPVPASDDAIPYFQLGLSDELKFNHNRKTYPQLVHEALGLPYRGDRYELPIDYQASAAAVAILQSRGWRSDRQTLGVNVGAGRVFANKMWPAEKTAAVIAQSLRPGVQVVLLGGRDERPIVDAIIARLRQLAPESTDQIIDPGTDHDERTFVGLIDACDVLFTGDTMAMHVAIARGKHAVVVFGPTCEQEIDLYGLGEKLVARPACAPCYKRVCDQGDVCVKEVTAGEAVMAIRRVLVAAAAKEKAMPSTIVLPVAPSRLAG